MKVTTAFALFNGAGLAMAQVGRYDGDEFELTARDYEVNEEHGLV